jgi:RNA-directed DNA polymerase
VVLVSGTEEDAIAEKEALANYLRQTTGLELSPEKTKITPVTEGFEFLGFHVAMRWDKRYGYFPRVEIPKAKVADLRHKIKVLTKVNTNLVPLGRKLEELNFILRGWSGYYRHCARAGKVFTAIDWFVARRIWCWLRKKYRKERARDIMRFFGPSSRRPTRRLWREGPREQYVLAWTSITRFLLGWMKPPPFAISSGEPDAYRKAHVRFGERHEKPPAARRNWSSSPTLPFYASVEQRDDPDLRASRSPSADPANAVSWRLPATKPGNSASGPPCLRSPPSGSART